MSPSTSSLSSPYVHSTVSVASPLSDWDCTLVTPDTPLIACSSGVATSSATSSGEVPG